MKLYCINNEEVLTEQEQRDIYEAEYNRDYYYWKSYEEFIEAVLEPSRSCITEEVDTGKIAENAKLIAAWANDFCGIGGASGKPDVEQFKYLKVLSEALKKIVSDQSLRDVYDQHDL